MTFRQVDVDNLANYGNSMAHFARNYDQYATAQHARVGAVRENAATIVFGAAVKKNEMNEVAKRAFSMAAHITSEIARMQSEKAALFVDVESSNYTGLGNLTPAEITRLNDNAKRGISNRFDPAIAALEDKRTAIADFLNNELNPFTQKIDSMVSKSSKYFAALDTIDKFDIGHAYIGLRMYFASTTIAKYCENVIADEEAAMTDLLRSLPVVVPDGTKVDPDNLIGVDWRATEAALIALAASGYKPPTTPPTRDVDPWTFPRVTPTGPGNDTSTGDGGDATNILPFDRDGDGTIDVFDTYPDDPNRQSFLDLPVAGPPAPTTTTVPPPFITPFPVQPSGMGNGGPGTQAYEDELTYSDGPGQNITNG